MIAEPPFDAGAVQVTVAERFPGAAVTVFGAPATVNAIAVTLADSVEAAESPTLLVALTLKP